VIQMMHPQATTNLPLTKYKQVLIAGYCHDGRPDHNYNVAPHSIFWIDSDSDFSCVDEKQNRTTSEELSA
jgi:hypothetical protein